MDPWQDLGLLSEKPWFSCIPRPVSEGRARGAAPQTKGWTSDPGTNEPSPKEQQVGPRVQKCFLRHPPSLGFSWKDQSLGPRRSAAGQLSKTCWGDRPQNSRPPNSQDNDRGQGAASLRPRPSPGETRPSRHSGLPGPLLPPAQPSSPHLLLNSVLLGHDGFIVGQTVNSWRKERADGRPRRPLLCAGTWVRPRSGSGPIPGSRPSPAADSSSPPLRGQELLQVTLRERAPHRPGEGVPQSPSRPGPPRGMEGAGGGGRHPCGEGEP